jgi:O-acetyl-ADP-ribose deacetylase (regulator of RNase III)
VATTAGRLKAKHVVHVPTIDYTSGRRAGLDDIYEGTKAALELCREMRLKRIAFPLLGAGIVGVPAREVALAMARAIYEFPEIETTLCAFSRADREAVAGLGDGA